MSDRPRTSDVSFLSNIVAPHDRRRHFEIKYHRPERKKEPKILLACFGPGKNTATPFMDAGRVRLMIITTDLIISNRTHLKRIK